ncbi:hypothetical protein ACFE04_015753 [Oxalis oulophora]
MYTHLLLDLPSDGVDYLVEELQDDGETVAYPLLGRAIEKFLGDIREEVYEDFKNDTKRLPNEENIRRDDQQYVLVTIVTPKGIRGSVLLRRENAKGSTHKESFGRLGAMELMHAIEGMYYMAKDVYKLRELEREQKKGKEKDEQAQLKTSIIERSSAHTIKLIAMIAEATRFTLLNFLMRTGVPFHRGNLIKSLVTNWAKIGFFLQIENWNTSVSYKDDQGNEKAALKAINPKTLSFKAGSDVIVWGGHAHPRGDGRRSHHRQPRRSNPRRRMRCWGSHACNRRPLVYGDLLLSAVQSTDETTSDYTKVGSLVEQLNTKEVLIRGRVHTIRPVSKKMAFIVVREKGKTVLCVVTVQPDVVSSWLILLLNLLFKTAFQDFLWVNLVEFV